MARGRPHHNPAEAVSGVRRHALNLLAAVLCFGLACAPERSREYLARAWETYKVSYIHPDGYVLDRSRNGGEVTSEGQGYALLRAAWMRDAPTFARVLDWTERHLRRPDGLYSWRWTPIGGGRVLDANTASDADQEIAFALLIAAAAWSTPEYHARARELLIAVRTREALTLGAGWFPAAGNWAVAERIINLSYFLPYAYPHFARADPDGGWDTVASSGYDILISVVRMPGVRLIPDFLHVTEDGRAYLLPPTAAVSRDFTSDAMRIFWRVALDCTLTGNDRACADPLDASRVTALLARDGALFTRYAVDGRVLERTESISFYGVALPYLARHAPSAAAALRAGRLSPKALSALAGDPHRYYDANWAWFGIGAADGFIAERTPRHGLEER